MKKVEMVIAGRPALVDEDMVEKMAKKEMLVLLASTYQKAGDTVNLGLTMSKIVRLNRTIRSTVRFI